ncbi:Gfo/Idh/MocA family protein [Paenibacillus sp. FSL H8-0034]|uniref:Gfo/Idh/MocA family protein n=1 Tax=Paenibacillus sp. FSL H8-0034 TaxID=2954671 RepID=UPI0030FA1386
MGEKIGVGLIGCGAISKAHIQAIQELTDLSLIGVTDRDVSLAARIAESTNTKSYPNSIDLVSDPDINLVVLLTPPYYHEELISLCANHGKHILAEKPVGVDMNKIKTYVDLCKQKGTQLSVVSQHRFDPSALFLREKIDQQKLGKLITANCTVHWHRPNSYYDSWHRSKSLAGGGVLVVQAIHTIDLMLWYMGDVEAVFGYTDRAVHTDIEVEDTAVVCLKFKNGAHGMISATTGTYPGYPSQLDIFGSSGSISIVGDEVSFYSSRLDQENSITDGLKGETNLDHGNISVASLKAQYKDVLLAIRNQSTPVVTGDEAAKTFAILEAIYESSRAGKAIRL